MALSAVDEVYREELDNVIPVTVCLHRAGRLALRDGELVLVWESS